MFSRFPLYFWMGAIGWLLAGASLSAQGVLLPSGPPAPTMRSLAQIEPRTPLGTPGQTITSTLTISEPGSYVLLAPIAVGEVDGIVITASNVTLDLNGFTISSTAGTGTHAGIRVAGASSISTVSIRNGAIVGSYRASTGSGSGFLEGVSAAGCKAFSASDLLISGVRSNGIVATEGGSSTLEDCHVWESGQGSVNGGVGGSTVGLRARLIRNCTVDQSRMDFGILGGQVEAVAVTDGRCLTGIRADSVTQSFGQGDEFGIFGSSIHHSAGVGRIGIYSTALVSHSQGTGLRGSNQATGIASLGSASYSLGRLQPALPETGTGENDRAIQAALAVACLAEGGVIEAPQKHLGTP